MFDTTQIAQTKVTVGSGETSARSFVTNMPEDQVKEIHKIAKEALVKDFEQEAGYCRTVNKVAMIKLIRAIFKCGLGEAKAFIEG